jgi:type I restriction enzyme R subunit
MSKVGQIEIKTQKRLIKLFKNTLDYDYLGDWKEKEDNRNVEVPLLTDWLTGRGHELPLINRVLDKLNKASAIGGATHLYDANRAVYGLLRYGVQVREDVGEKMQTVWLIDWKNPENNHFAIAEEVTVQGDVNRKRPDIVMYVNGIALGIIELKRSIVSVSEGIRQNISNQRKDFIERFFSTVQLLFAGNDTEGLRHGVIGTPEQFYLQWKEESDIENPLDRAITQMCSKARFLELIHDFIVFHAGIKKTCRTNQFFGVKAAQNHVTNREGGIIWHSQGSGKSLLMVWLAKWIKENIPSSRVLILTDRTELDDQIEKQFVGVEEEIAKAKNGKKLFQMLNESTEWLLCSLIHKFGSSDKTDDKAFVEDIKKLLPNGFQAKGELFVFIDECHRTQSGKMHRAMKEIIGEGATVIGFTGTPLMKRDKASSQKTFGPYIHTYKYDEAVADKVILDLRYEARSVEQKLVSVDKVDQWFDAKTKNLNEIAKAKIKRKWGSIRKVYSSKPRLKIIADEILFDMATKPRLVSGQGNAMLVASGIPEACRYYEIFRKSLKEKCAIVSSYEPHASDIALEDSGEGDTQDIMKYEVYTKMLADWFDEPVDQAKNKAVEFEKQVKKLFVEEPGRMKLLIVVDKLLTGFDAPSATYLYIDKSMQDHGLFQAICRVNRLDDESKEHGYIVDYKDLFNSIEGAFDDYTGDAFDGYDKADVEGLLKNRLEMSKKRLEESLEQVKALCEPVAKPKGTEEYISYFCTSPPYTEPEEKLDQEKRTKFYKLTRTLIRAFGELAPEMDLVGYSVSEISSIKTDVKHFEKVFEEIQIASADYIDLKLYEPGMRHLIDSYIRAEDAVTLTSFDDMSLVELLVSEGETALDKLPKGIRQNKRLVAETMTPNIRRLIVDRRSVNPHYYDKMSQILEDLIRQAKGEAIEYQKYLDELVKLAKMVVERETGEKRPDEINTSGKADLYDNLGKDVELTLKVHNTTINNAEDGWRDNKMKQRKLKRALQSILPGKMLEGQTDLVDILVNIASGHSEY